jgi:hypothetical protein
MGFLAHRTDTEDHIKQDWNRRKNCKYKNSSNNPRHKEKTPYA